VGDVTKARLTPHLFPTFLFKVTNDYCSDLWRQSKVSKGSDVVLAPRLGIQENRPRNRNLKYFKGVKLNPSKTETHRFYILANPAFVCLLQYFSFTSNPGGWTGPLLLEQWVHHVINQWQCSWNPSYHVSFFVPKLKDTLEQVSGDVSLVPRISHWNFLEVVMIVSVDIGRTLKWTLFEIEINNWL
jgi:hypothetical protein